MEELVPIETIQTKIILIRGDKVLLDRDLAELYGVETKRLKQTVRRNMERFPEDFMFELSEQEFTVWRTQFVTSNTDKMGLRYRPMAFTEHGVAMLSSVLRSNRAVQVNIAIMRAFGRMRQLLSSNEELKVRIEAMEKKYDGNFRIIFTAIKELMEPEKKSKMKKIGF
ncbi:MAG: ORF6N domain-containing protein [Thermodesulfobacteriota bacterium]